MKKSHLKSRIAFLCLCGLLGSGVSASAAPADAISPAGVVEGFYGTPWSQQDRLSMLEFMGAHHLNMYVYAPKDDPYHREKWREAYPPKEMQRLQQLIRTAHDNNVEFVFAISPGLDMKFTGSEGQADLRALIQKFDTLYAAGVRQFAVLFDDIQNKDALRQVKVLNEVNRAFIHKHADVKPLFTVPTEYFSEDMIEKGKVKPYTAAMAKNLDTDIQVLYTGSGVVAEAVTLEDIQKIEQVYQRKMSIWCNYPVTDYMRTKLALGPMVGMAPGVASHTAAFLMNPMEHAELSRIALATGADYAADPSAYDPEASWRKALTEEYGPLADDMRAFAEHSQHMENDWAKAGRPDAPVMRQHMNELWQALRSGQESSASQLVLKRDFSDLTAALQRIEQNLPPKQLDQIHPQLQLLQQLTAADQTALLLVQAQTTGMPHAADVLGRRLAHEKSALLPEKTAIISEKTAAAFLQETLDWQQAQKSPQKKAAR